MKKTYVIGDIHGAYRALIQVIERSGADINNDIFIVLGDVTDGWSEVSESIEFLMSIKNLIYINGNHDMWTCKFLNNPPKFSQSGEYMLWKQQGGQATINSYKENPELMEKHLEFLNNSLSYYEDEENRLFIHGGYDPKVPISEQSRSDIAWDRWFWSRVRESRTTKHLKISYDEVYIGHSVTIRYPEKDGSHKRPMNFGKVWNMDTGATYDGMLSMMDINSKEIWQSDVVMDLYPDQKGRN